MEQGDSPGNASDITQQLYQRKHTLRVQLLTDGFLPYVVQLANALSPEHDVSLLIGGSKLKSREADQSEASCDSDLITDVLSNQVLATWLTRPRRRDPRSILSVRNAISLIKSWDPDIIHVQDSFDYRTLLTISAASRRYPVVLTVHDVRIHSGEEHQYKGYSLWVRNRLRRIADEVIVHGEHLRRLLVSDLNISTRHVHVHPHGEFSLFRRWIRPDVAEEDHLVLFFGRIWPYKGLEDLIRAEPLITQRVPDARIMIAGRGEDFGRYQRLMVNPQRFAVLNRYVPNDLVADLFQRASVVALPYTEASQSGVVAIAYAFGKPVVGTNVGSIPEIVESGRTGLIVPPNNPLRLAEAIISLLTNKHLRKQMGEGARLKAMTEMSWPAIAEKVARIYQRAVPPSRAASKTDG